MQVRKHLVSRAPQHIGDVARAHARPHLERELIGALDVVPVEEHRVSVPIELHCTVGFGVPNHTAAYLAYLPADLTPN